MDKKIKDFFPYMNGIIDTEMEQENAIEAARKVKLGTTIIITGIIFMLVFGTLSLVNGHILMGFFDHTAALALLLNMVYLRKSRNYKFACYFGVTIVGILYFYLFITGGVNNTTHFWYFTFPLFSSFVIGAKRGAFATALLLVLTIIFYLLNLDLPFLTHYPTGFILRFVLSMIVVSIFAYAFEYFREEAEKKLVSKNNELNRKMEELKEAYTMLRKAREDLEKRVKERTDELLRTNIDLRYEIKARKEMEEERRSLETRLAQSRKMEAIGTLAGGVAHDLNNILSATVSYPDLILMDLPEDSPLRAPILTIQESGKRAAAVVQDLLTLARRGVVLTKVTNLNQIIEDYLQSPELAELETLHPEVVINTRIDPDLFNIMGSPVHLSKTVMNLVTNAAEAMADGGEIIISTQNRYLDKPVTGYDDINEGDYVVLIVSDTGSGISEQDLVRIFEPFFTKKMMGRSGTGLGMAVVWGAVKDHNGYIDVKSTKGIGTTFTLYFPVTRENTLDNKKEPSILAYMGSNETILVVDDIEEQRTIASKMLTRLGYSVVTAPGGEAAIEYMKESSADLLILDMIMEPGIDGLDTYKEILKLHPDQKAVIASGFSATDRVREVQRMGAGAYIKKPYTMEKIGMVVKELLQGK